MKNKFYNWIFKLVMTFIAKRLVHSSNKLTPEYLLSKGWIISFDEVRKKSFYIEDDVKDRDLISVEFDGNGYRVWHSEKRTFIAAETSLEWFELYYLLIHPDNGRYKLAGI